MRSRKGNLLLPLAVFRCSALFFFAVISLLRLAKTEGFRSRGSDSGCIFLEEQR